MPKTGSRIPGKSGIVVSPMGPSCWAINGPFWSGEQPLGRGEVDDEESIRAIHAVLDLGITERNVKAPLASIYNKFGVDSRAAAITVASQHGLLPNDI